MSTSSEKDTTTSNKVDPWAPQASALQSAFTNAQGAYDQASKAVAPTDFTAQMTPEQLSTFKSMIAQGGNQAIPQQNAATGTALQGAGTSGVSGALSGLLGFNPSGTDPSSLVNSANQYVAGQNIPAQVKAAMQNATETARDVTMPGIEQNAAIGGNTNSSRTGIAQGLVERGLAEQSANLNGSLSGQAFNNGLTLASNNANTGNAQRLGALSSAGGIGNTAAATGVGADSASIANQGALDSTAMAGGAGLQGANQANLTNQLQQYQSGVQTPFNPLTQLMSIIGSNNWGSSSNGTSNTTTTPSMFDTISGLMSSGGSLAMGLGKFPDRRIKKNITRVGTLDNGLPVYTFLYKWQHDDAALNLGLMAQEVELVHPDAVSEINGIKVVNYKLACV